MSTKIVKRITSIIQMWTVTSNNKLGGEGWVLESSPLYINMEEAFLELLIQVQMMEVGGWRDEKALQYETCPSICQYACNRRVLEEVLEWWWEMIKTSCYYSRRRGISWLKCITYWPEFFWFLCVRHKHESFSWKYPNRKENAES